MKWSWKGAWRGVVLLLLCVATFTVLWVLGDTVRLALTAIAGESAGAAGQVVLGAILVAAALGGISSREEGVIEMSDDMTMLELREQVGTAEILRRVREYDQIRNLVDGETVREGADMPVLRRMLREWFPRMGKR